MAKFTPSRKRREIARVWVLSTAHVRYRDMQLLKVRRGDEQSLIVHNHEYGCLVGVDEEHAREHRRQLLEFGFSRALLRLLLSAARLGCEWLQLDGAGPIDKEFPTFDW